MRRAGASLALVWLVTGCPSRDREPSRGTSPSPRAGAIDASAAKESRVFDIKTSDDLLALNGKYMELCSSGFDGTVEISVGPGPFTGIGWGLTPEKAGGECTIDVVIRGSGSAFPFPGHVRARSLSLDNVVITGPVAGGSEVRVSRGFSMKRSMLVDARLSDPNWAGGYLEVYAEGGRASPVRVDIEDCWFVRNFQTQIAASLLRLDTRGVSAGVFDQVNIRRSAFLGNAFAADVSVYLAQHVSVEGSLFYRTWAGAGAELRCASCGDVAISGSTFVVENLDQVAALEVTPAVTVKDSRVLVRGWKAGTSPPAALAITPVQIADRQPFEAREAVVTEAITALTTSPLRAAPADLWKRVQDAFGP